MAKQTNLIIDMDLSGTHEELGRKSRPMFCRRVANVLQS